jgi:DNA-binding transcriptional ArsR family regulator
MSRSRPERHSHLAGRAAVFAALGDETRLSLVGKLSSGLPISRLAERSKLTRQAITKHLRVLEGAGVVRSIRAGRESLFAFRPEPFRDLQSYLHQVSGQWDHALES